MLFLLKAHLTRKLLFIMKNNLLQANSTLMSSQAHNSFIHLAFIGFAIFCISSLLHIINFLTEHSPLVHFVKKQAQNKYIQNKPLSKLLG